MKQMKKMSYLLSLSIITAILCGAWSALSTIAGFIGWAGFAGCTTFFACGEHGFHGIKKSVITNITGVFCGMAIILLGNVVPAFDRAGVWCAIVTFVMCYLSKYESFNFCPGIFVGCFTTFAANGNWLVLIPSLIIGACLGAACEFGGSQLFKLSTKDTSAP